MQRSGWSLRTPLGLSDPVRENPKSPSDRWLLGLRQHRGVGVRSACVSSALCRALRLAPGAQAGAPWRRPFPQGCVARARAGSHSRRRDDRGMAQSTVDTEINNLILKSWGLCISTRAARVCPDPAMGTGVPTLGPCPGHPTPATWPGHGRDKRARRAGPVTWSHGLSHGSAAGGPARWGPEQLRPRNARPPGPGLAGCGQTPRFEGSSEGYWSRRLAGETAPWPLAQPCPARPRAAPGARARGCPTGSVRLTAGLPRSLLPSGFLTIGVFSKKPCPSRCAGVGQR